MLGRARFSLFWYGVLGAGGLFALHLAAPAETSVPGSSSQGPARAMFPVAVVSAQEQTPPAPAAEAAPKAPETITNPIDGAEMLVVPAGEFKMGSESGDEDERPVHTVKLKGFRLYKTEVTNAQYAKFMAATGHREPLFWKEQRFNQPKQPVVGVDWNDAVAYCRWAGTRLPTEAEWEYSARGTDGRELPWGGAGGRRRGGGGGGGGGARAVMDLPFNQGKPGEVGAMAAGASPMGAMDMAGNAWEWCADWYDRTYYSRSPGENPSGPETGQQRVLRGGGWGYPSNVRCPYRFPEQPTFRASYAGFRCVQDLPPAQVAATP